MKLSLLLFLVIISCAQIATAQYPTVSPPTDNSETFLAESFSLGCSSPDSATIVVLYRMRFDMLQFQRLGATQFVARGDYFAIARINVEIHDSLGIIRCKREWLDTIYTTSSEASNLRGKWLSGASECIVAAGRYTPYIIIKDPNGSPIKRIKLAATDAPAQSLARADLIFARVVQNPARDRIEPVISNNNAPFESDGISAVIALNASKTLSYTYTITPDNDNDWGDPPAISGIPDIRSDIRLERISSATVQFPPHRLQYETTPDKKTQTIILTIRLPENSILPGQYRLTVISSTGDTLSRLFRVQWETIPASFSDVRYALVLMRYILTDKEYEDISNNPQKRRAIIDYWRKLDPTPFTVYNEAMAEYFRRADAAAVQFTTLAERNGALSDRGKIYILHGWPDAIEHPDSAKGIREIWIYSKKLNKHFIFEQNTAGAYRLIQITE